MSHSEEDSTEDQLCFLRTVEAFRTYHSHSVRNHINRTDHMRHLSPAHKAILGVDAERLFASQVQCSAANAAFFDKIVAASQYLFSVYWPHVHPSITMPPQPNAMDIDKTYSTLRQFVRDWSVEGKAERDQCYAPLTKKLIEIFPDAHARPDVRVLVPGAGLSRLSFDISLLGFFSQGNEFSYHMLIAGHYILNHVVQSNIHPVYAYADTSVNNLSRADQLLCTLVPDTSATELMHACVERGDPIGEFSMIAGEFIEVYSKPSELDSWNCVITCFFIDTAHNVIEYIECIYNALVEGGAWLNLGPLLYHWTGMADEASLDLTYEEVMHVVRTVGFVVVEERDAECTYTNNPRSMKQNLYSCKYFHALKPFRT